MISPAAASVGAYRQSGLPPVSPDSPFARFSTPGAAGIPAQNPPGAMVYPQHSPPGNPSGSRQQATDPQPPLAKRFSMPKKTLRQEKPSKPIKKPPKASLDQDRVELQEQQPLYPPNFSIHDSSLLLPGGQPDKPPMFEWRSPFYHPTYAEMAMAPSRKEKLALKKTQKQQASLPERKRVLQERQPALATKTRPWEDERDEEGIKRPPPTPAEIRENPNARRQRSHELAVLKANPWNDHLFANSQA